MAVHHAVGISRQSNSGYRPSRVNVVAQGFSTLDPSLSPTHFSIRTGRATTTHYTHHQVMLVVSRNTTLVPFLGLRLGPACEAGLSTGMRRSACHPKGEIERERKKVGTERSPSPPRPLLAVPNVTAHSSTASVPSPLLSVALLFQCAHKRLTYVSVDKTSQFRVCTLFSFRNYASSVYAGVQTVKHSVKTTLRMLASLRNRTIARSLHIRTGM